DKFGFGNSLTVRGNNVKLIGHHSLLTTNHPPLYLSISLGGILTVADDLLKNDGKKFLDMMERLAERRM
ncbi:hypothetical protein CLU79DRAFT_668524, partial [Phycomyces nitens]